MQTPYFTTIPQEKKATAVVGNDSNLSESGRG